MKLTTLLLCSFLAFIGFDVMLYALSGFDLLFFLCAGNRMLWRGILSLSGIAAGWLIFWLIAFRPTKPLS